MSGAPLRLEIPKRRPEDDPRDTNRVGHKPTNKKASFHHSTKNKASKEKQQQFQGRRNNKVGAAEALMRLHYERKGGGSRQNLKRTRRKRLSKK